MKFQKGHKINNERVPWNKGLTSKNNEKVRIIGVKKRGRIVPIEVRKKISETRKKLFEEGKIVHPLKGVHLSEEHKNKLRKSHLGKICSEEHKKKISEANKGHFVSEETKKKIGINNAEKLKGKEISEEHRRNIIKSLLGRKHSEETKEKISKSEKENLFVVHHINGNHFDNSPENLIRITRKEHIILHHLQGDINPRGKEFA